MGLSLADKQEAIFVFFVAIFSVFLRALCGLCG
jgi:hypothetical protein